MFLVVEQRNSLLAEILLFHGLVDEFVFGCLTACHRGTLLLLLFILLGKLLLLSEIHLTFPRQTSIDLKFLRQDEIIIALYFHFFLIFVLFYIDA
jgi:hypothetical protein